MEDRTKLQKYEEMQAMVRKEVETMFPNLFKQYATQFGVNKTPTHTHNGTDSVQIQEVNVIKNIKYNFGIQINTEETFYIKAIPNLKSITFLGFAANNVSVAATKRGIVNGKAVFGKCFEFDSAGSTVTPTSSLIGKEISQGSNYMFVDSTSLANNRVGFDSTLLVRVADNTATDVATLEVVSYNGKVIGITSTLESDWQIFGTFILE